MRRISLMLAFVVAALVSGAQSEVRKNALKLNPLSLALVTGNVSYERAVGASQSVQLGVFYSGITLSDLKYAGFGITPEYRFYVAGKKEALNGVYVAPFARYQRYALTDKVSKNEASFSSIGGGATIGWQKMWSSGFTLDLFAGPAYNAGKFKNESDEDAFDLKAGINGFGIRTGLTIGFGF